MNTLVLVLAQLDGVMQAVSPSGYTWWQSIIHFAMLSMIGLFAWTYRIQMKQRMAERRADAGLKRKLKELKGMLEEDLLTKEEFAEQKEAVLAQSKMLQSVQPVTQTQPASA